LLATADIHLDYYLDIIQTQELRGLVLETYGAGLFKCLLEGSERGIAIVNITQCNAGRVEMGR